MESKLKDLKIALQKDIYPLLQEIKKAEESREMLKTIHTYSLISGFVSQWKSDNRQRIIFPDEMEILIDLHILYSEMKRVKTDGFQKDRFKKALERVLKNGYMSLSEKIFANLAA